jgi:hypothetical protein
MFIGDRSRPAISCGGHGSSRERWFVQDIFLTHGQLRFLADPISQRGDPYDGRNSFDRVAFVVVGCRS